MRKSMAFALITAALIAAATGAFAQGNPVDIRARDDAERAQRDYRDAVRARDAAADRERNERVRSQMLPDPGPVPAIAPPTPSATIPGVYPDPAQRIQAEEAARARALAAEQAKRDLDAAERAKRDAENRLPRQ